MKINSGCLELSEFIHSDSDNIK